VSHSDRNFSENSTGRFKYDRDWLCVNKSQFVPVIFEPPCSLRVFEIRDLGLYINPRVSSHWGKNILLSTLFSNSPNLLYVLPLTREITFHVHTRQRTNLQYRLFEFLRFCTSHTKTLDSELHGCDIPCIWSAFNLLRMQFDFRRYETQWVRCALNATIYLLLLQTKPASNKATLQAIRTQWYVQAIVLYVALIQHVVMHSASGCGWLKLTLKTEAIRVCKTRLHDVTSK
jgi:hypothetical protein